MGTPAEPTHAKKTDFIPPQAPSSHTSQEALKESRSFAHYLASLDAKLSLYSSTYTIIFVFALSNIVAFFFEAVPEYHRRGQDKFLAWLIGISRGCGNVLNLNFALVILLGARYTFTWLRATPLNLIIPFDKAMPHFHVAVASTSLGFAVVHCLLHLIAGLSRGSWAKGFGKWTWSFVTGMVLSVAFVAIVITSIKSRRKKSFETFYYTHLIGAILTYLLLILHGTHHNKLHTWKWILAPMIIYIVDRLIRKSNERLGSFKLDANCRAEFKKGNILRLAVTKPFDFRAGQYAEIKVFALSKAQWHPFTIASAPHETDMVFFIKAMGDWTTKLHDLVRKVSTMPESTLQSNHLVHIRGPYGAPSEHVGQHDKVVLIGAGVGSTPFCSIAKDAHYRIGNSYHAQACTNARVNEMSHGPDERKGFNDRRKNPRSGSDDESTSGHETVSNETLEEIPFQDAGRTAQFIGKKSPRLSEPGLKYSGASFLSDFSRASKISKSGHVRKDLLSSLTIVTVNLYLLWIILVRFAFLLIFVAFRYLDVKSNALLLLRPLLGTSIDLALAILFALPMCGIILTECFLWKADILDILILFPLSLAPIMIDLLALYGTGKTFGKATRQKIFFVSPCLLIAFLVRYFRILGSRVLLAERYTNSHATTKSVDVIWTSPTREADEWLVEELWPIATSNTLRVFRFITRESRDVELQLPSDSNKDLEGHECFATQYGRPDFDELFKSLASNVQSGSTVGIFFCGPPQMAAQIRESAIAAMIDQRTTEELHLILEGYENNGEILGANDKANMVKHKVRRRPKDKWWIKQNARFIFREENFL